MSDRNEEKIRNGKVSIPDETFEELSENYLDGSIKLDVVDWGAVARSYKILGLRASDPKTFERNEKLRNDYNRWVAKRINEIEFDIALRMHFDEIITAEQFLSATEDDSMNPDISGIALKRLAAECRGNMKTGNMKMRCPAANKTKEAAKIEDPTKPKSVRVNGGIDLNDRNNWKRPNMKKLILFCTMIAASAAWNQVQTQQVGIKTNLLYDATATFNLGAEFRLGDRTSLDVPINWNPFTFRENRKWKHLLVQPELRLWTRETFSGHFFGLHAHYAIFNVGNLPKPFSQYMRDHRFDISETPVKMGRAFGHKL